jgi:rare lipoprotein A
MSWTRALLLNVAVLALASIAGGPDQVSIAALRAHQGMAVVKPDLDSRRSWRDFSSTEEDAESDRFEQVGIASWYGPWHHGRQTASGEIFDMNKMTAAHRSLPLGTRVRVTNLENGLAVAVKINDRGPYIDGRVIDLSKGAAQALNMVRAGIVPVKVEEIESAPVQTANGRRAPAGVLN